MRLIDADALMQSLGITNMDCKKCGWHDVWGRCRRGGDFEDACCAIEDAPTIEPRKKGKWIDTGSGQKCSECHEIQYGYDNFRYFCAFCGADMKTEEADCDYERAVEQLEHDILYEPTFNQGDGSM